MADVQEKQQSVRPTALESATTTSPPQKQAISVKPTKEKPKMSQEAAFAPVRNPANPDRVFIYRVAPSVHTLSYDQRALHKGVAAPRWNKNPTDTEQDDSQPPGVLSTLIRADSNIVSLVFDDVVGTRRLTSN